MAAAELMRRNSRRGIPADTALAFIRLSITFLGERAPLVQLRGDSDWTQNTSTASRSVRDAGHRHSATPAAGPSTSVDAPPFAAATAALIEPTSPPATPRTEIRDCGEPAR